MDTLYHYCPTNTFHSIISNQSIWLSSLSLSSDTMEGKLVSKIMTELAFQDNLSQEELQNLNSHIQYLENTIDNLGFCLSKKGDLLSQWRGYADNAMGVSIGFSTKYLQELCYPIEDNKEDDISPSLSLKEVHYETDRQIVVLRPLYKKILELAKQGAFKNYTVPSLCTRSRLDTPTENEFKSDIEKLDRLKQSIMLTLLVFSGDLYTLKSNAFKEEEEWRLIAPFFKLLKPDGSTPLFRSTNNRIIPYYEIKIDKLPKNAIKHLVLGPRNHTPHDVIKVFLNKYGFEDVKIDNSEATYRG